MDIVIKTGFAKIYHKINFQKQTEPKGKGLAEVLHVRDAEEHRHNGVSYLIKANVVRQVSVHETAYSVKLEIDSNRMVTAVHCNCVYNRSEKCKHVAAVIYFINNYESLSKTSFEQQWGMPTARQFVKEKYSKGCDFDVMFPPPKKPFITPVPVDVSKLKSPSASRNSLLVNPNSYKESEERLAKTALQTQLSKEKECCAQYVKAEELKRFYEEKIVLNSTDEIVKLCCDTLNQSHNDNWYGARRLRTTASKNAHSIKIRKTRSIESVVQEIVYPKKVDSPYLAYGRTHEKDACKEYELLYNVHLHQFGLVVCQNQPWLSASLDGAVIRNASIEKLVEFKCPISCSKMPIVDFDKKTCNVNYLKLGDDKTVVLNDKNIYYKKIKNIY